MGQARRLSAMLNRSAFLAGVLPPLRAFQTLYRHTMEKKKEDGVHTKTRLAFPLPFGVATEHALCVPNASFFSSPAQNRKKKSTARQLDVRKRKKKARSEKRKGGTDDVGKRVGDVESRSTGTKRALCDTRRRRPMIDG